MKKNRRGPAVSRTRLLDILTDLVAALESGIIYDDNGAWCIGMHGDTDVTNIVGKPIADAKAVLDMDLKECIREAIN